MRNSPRDTDSSANPQALAKELHPHGASETNRFSRLRDRAAGLAAFLVISTAVTLPAAAQTPSFLGLGQMPGVWPAGGTYASAISADGTTIMGYGWVCQLGWTTCTSSDMVQAYRWTVGGGYKILGSPGNSSYFGAGAVSSDGSVIVGEHPQPVGFAAFRWTAAQGMKELPMNIANAVTADGAMVAGGDNWWKASGQKGIFGPFPGEQDQTQANGLSGTSQAPVAVGAAIKGTDAFGPTFHAFRWMPVKGLQDLGLTKGTESIAIAISADGSVIVGEARDANRFWRAFRWTASTGMIDIGTLGGPESAALAVNKDGTVIVGTSLTSSSSSSNHIFRWTRSTGMQDLLAALQTAGVHNADKWVQLNSMVGVSSDGAVMVGYGLSPRTSAFPFGQWEPFRIVLPVPASVAASSTVAGH
jgi:probable HAF family extracellular repeat protein